MCKASTSTLGVCSATTLILIALPNRTLKCSSSQQNAAAPHQLPVGAEVWGEQGQGLALLGTCAVAAVVSNCVCPGTAREQMSTLCVRKMAHTLAVVT